MNRNDSSTRSLIIFFFTLCALTVLSAYSVSLAEEIEWLSDPFLLSDLSYQPASESQSDPSVVFGNGEFLVIWGDVRRLAYGRDIYGARIGLDGAILENAGICIASDYPAGGRPTVGWNGTDYLIAWPSLDGINKNIVGRRVSADGIPNDEYFTIGEGALVQNEPAVASDGSDWLVVWRDERNIPEDQYHEKFWPDIYASRVGADGAALDSEGIQVSVTDTELRDPQVAYGGGIYLVVWRELEEMAQGQWRNDILAARISLSGELLDPESMVLTGSTDAQTDYPALAWNQGAFQVVWEQEVEAGASETSHIFGARIHPDGTILDPGGFQITTHLGGQIRPRIACDENNCLVIHTDCRYEDEAQGCDLFSSRVLPDGTVIDPEGTFHDAANTHATPVDADVAYGSGVYLAAWERVGRIWSDIQALRITPEGTDADEEFFTVSNAATRQRYPSAAFDGVNFLAVWEDDARYEISTERTDVHAARFTPEGIVLDPEGIVIADGYWFQDQPDMIFNGENYIVVWQGRRNYSKYVPLIVGARVTPAGVVLDPGGVALVESSHSLSMPALDNGGDNHLLVFRYWEDNLSQISAVRFTDDMQVLDDPWITISENGDERDPDVAFCGSNYLVGWWNYTQYSQQVKVARVATDGQVLDEGGILISGGTSNHSSPSITCVGSTALVLWSDQRNGLDPSLYDLYGQFVDGDQGTLIGENFLISGAEQWQIDGMASYDGANYLVTWRDYRIFETGLDYKQEIYHARVTPQGEVLDPEAYPLSITPAYQYGAIPVCTGTGTCAVVYSHFMEEPGINNSRVAATMIAMADMPVTTTIPTATTTTTTGVSTTSTTPTTTTTTIPQDDDADDDGDDDDIVDDDVTTDDDSDDDQSDDDLLDGGDESSDDGDSSGLCGF